MKANHLSGMIIWLIAILAFAGCGRQQPIKIGFVGGLTGKFSDLGMAGRDGALLAVEQANAGGGIDGRPVELIMRDDKQDPDEVLKVDRELLDSGVWAIIGHMTSSMSIVAVPLMDQRHVVMISPTSSTNKLTGKDDYFFRTVPPNKGEAHRLAQHAAKEMRLRTMEILYDLTNRAYTEGYSETFKKKYKKEGGLIVGVSAFVSGPNLDYIALARDALQNDPDGLLIIAGALDTAMISQQIRRLDRNVRLLASGWAMTDAILTNGGPAVEDMIFFQLFDRDSGNPRYVRFKRDFKERFGRDPDFGAAYSYEATQILLTSIKSATDPHDLKRAILSKGKFPGLQGDIVIDAFGDPHKDYIQVRIHNDQFEAVR